MNAFVTLNIVNPQQYNLMLIETNSSIHAFLWEEALLDIGQIDKLKPQAFTFNRRVHSVLELNNLYLEKKKNYA